MVPLTSKSCQAWKAPRPAEDLSLPSPKSPGALCGPILATYWNCPVLEQESLCALDHCGQRS